MNSGSMERALPAGIDPDPENMWIELEASRMLNDRYFHAWNGMISRYTGPYFDRDQITTSKEPENPGFELIATMSAQIVSGDPQCTAKAMRTDRPDTRMKAVALKHSINRWARNTKLKRLYKKLLVDYFFRRASTKITRVRAPWADRGPLDGPSWRPALTRVSPPMLRYDPRALDWEDTRWRGDGQMVSRSSVRAWAKKGEKGWRLDQLDLIDVEILTKESRDMMPREGQALHKRDDFMLWNVWFPEEQCDEKLTPEKGFHGTLRYYAQSTREKNGKRAPLIEIRDPQAFFGPRRGPYNMAGQFYVPDHVEPLSVMTAIEHIARSLAIRSAVIERAMTEYRRFLIEGTGTRNLGNLIKNAKHGGIIKAKGYQKGQAEAFTIGGIDEVLMTMFQFDQGRMRQLSGLTEAMKGNPTAGTTATAEALAQGGATARVSDTRDVFYDFCGLDLEGVGEIMCMDDQFYMPLPPDAVREMEPHPQGRDGKAVVPIGYQGGYEKGETFEDLEIALMPLSMKHMEQGDIEAAADREMAMWQGLAPLIPQTTFMDWKSILQDRADAYGNDALAERVNYAQAEQIAGVLLHMQIQGAFAPGDQQPKAQSAVDSGKRPNTPTLPVGGPSVPRPPQFGKPTPAAIGAGAKVKGASLPGNSAGQKASKGIAKLGSTR